MKPINFFQLADSTFSTIKRKMHQVSKLMDDMNQDYFSNIEESFHSFVDELKTKLTDTKDVYTITVPFDKSMGDEIVYSITNGVMRIHISRNTEHESTNTTSEISLPKDLDFDSMSQVYNDETKTMEFNFKKTKIKSKNKKMSDAQKLFKKLHNQAKK